MKQVIIFLLYMLSFSKIEGQKKSLSELDHKLSNYGDIILNSIDSTLKANHYDSAKILLTRFFDTPESFHFHFKESNFISILYPKDSSFRILTFQMILSNNKAQYFGAIQMKNQKHVMLSDRMNDIISANADPQMQEFKSVDWPGCLYYNLFPCQNKKTNYYLLLGYNYYSENVRIKIMDILSFNKDGEPLFGMDIFEPDTVNMEDNDYRKIYFFSTSTSFFLNYDIELNKIVLDHLAPLKISNNETKMVPDGSLEAWEYIKGHWHHIDVLEQIPLDNINIQPSIYKNSKVNIHGKPKN